MTLLQLFCAWLQQVLLWFELVACLAQLDLSSDYTRFPLETRTMPVMNEYEEIRYLDEIFPHFLQAGGIHNLGIFSISQKKRLKLHVWKNWGIGEP